MKDVDARRKAFEALREAIPLVYWFWSADNRISIIEVRCGE